MTTPATRNPTDAPVGGTIVSGIVPNRDNKTAPDYEQKKREQARQESDWARGKRTSHPSFTKTGPDRSTAKRDSSNVTIEQAREQGRVL